jgi:hypothetical protein
MIVMLKNARSEHWLTAGLPYAVLAIDGRYCRLVDDGGAPTLFAMTAFDVVDPTVAPQWEFRKGPGGHVALATAVFHRPGYFEDVFDRVPGSDGAIVAFQSMTTEERSRFTAWFSTGGQATSLPVGGGGRP